MSNEILQKWLAAYEEPTPDGSPGQKKVSDEALRRWMAAYDETWIVTRSLTDGTRLFRRGGSLR